MKKNKKVSAKEINFLHCVIQNSVDLSSSSVNNEKRIERAMAIVDALVANQK